METNIQELGKDPNMLILNQLDDEKLVLICQTNKFYQKICNDQIFWMNRVLNKFANEPIDIEQLRKYKGTKIDSDTKQERDRTWSEYYIEDLRVINNKNAQDYLEKASKNGRLDQLILAVLAGANIRASQDVAVVWVARNGHLDLLKYLVSLGANVRAREDDAVVWAAAYGHLDVVNYLVSQEADIRTQNDWAIRWAALNGHLEVVKYLVSRGVNIHVNQDEAVKSAARKGHIEVVNYLVSLGAPDPR